MTRYITPAPEEIPKIPGIDIYGASVPYNGMAGGDLITYMNFQERFDLNKRIQSALANGQDGVVQNLQRLNRTGGILVADVAGHNYTDAVRDIRLHWYSPANTTASWP